MLNNNANYRDYQISEKQAKEAERANILSAFEISLKILDRRYKIGKIGDYQYDSELLNLADNLKKVMAQ